MASYKDSKERGTFGRYQYVKKNEKAIIHLLICINGVYLFVNSGMWQNACI